MQTGVLKKSFFAQGGIVMHPHLIIEKDELEYVIPIGKLPFAKGNLRTWELHKLIKSAKNILDAEKIIYYYGTTEADAIKMWGKIQWILLNLFPCDSGMPYRPFLTKPGLASCLGKAMFPPPLRKPLSVFDKWYNWGKALTPDSTEFSPYIKAKMTYFN
jgi:hypothetical protein